MNGDSERDLGEQPIARIMVDHDLKAHDLVDISTQHITHKMVSRACKGRRLTPNVKSKIRDALNNATDKTYTTKDLFTYQSVPRILKKEERTTPCLSKCCVFVKGEGKRQRERFKQIRKKLEAA